MPGMDIVWVLCDFVYGLIGVASAVLIPYNILYWHDTYMLVACILLVLCGIWFVISAIKTIRDDLRKK